jgi:hypothetical protein
MKVSKGQRFGRLLVITEAGRGRRGEGKWECRCDCGQIVLVFGSNLQKGNTRSCGCFKRDHQLATHLTHGKTKGGRSPVYSVWSTMIQRCTNPKDSHFPRYGGRGITVCDRWRKFENFLADMGEPIGDISIERIDNHAGYSPDNCRWATRIEQGSNRRDNRLVTCKGETLHLAEWARRKGLNYQTLFRRLFYYGWDVERALNTPVIRPIGGAD